MTMFLAFNGLLVTTDLSDSVTQQGLHTFWASRPRAPLADKTFPSGLLFFPAYVQQAFYLILFQNGADGFLQSAFWFIYRLAFAGGQFFSRLLLPCSDALPTAGPDEPPMLQSE